MISEFIYDVCTVCGRDFTVLKRRLVKFVLSRMVAPVLYLVAFGWGLGRSIDVNGGYMDYLVPGLIALNSMNVSFSGVIPVHAERVYHKSLEEYILSPIKPSAFVMGKIMGGALRGLISCAILFACRNFRREYIFNSSCDSCCDCKFSALCRLWFFCRHENRHL